MTKAKQGAGSKTPDKPDAANTEAACADTSCTGTDPVSAAADALAQGIQTAGQIAGNWMRAVQQVNDKFTCTASSVSAKDAVGQDAEVTVAVPPGGAGEVILSLGGSLRHYSARGKDGRKSFKRGEKVRVVDAASDTLYLAEKK